MGVTSIVTGHFLKEGDQLEITLEAVDIASNRSIWRDTINAATSDRIAMREQITSRVRQELVPALGAASAVTELGTRHKSEEAYDLYLRSIAVPHDAIPNKDAISMLGVCPNNGKPRLATTSICGPTRRVPQHMKAKLITRSHS